MIEELLANYKPSREAIDQVVDARIALLVGISGAGKDTIKQELLAGGGFYNFISHTTRPPRTNNGVMEQDGVDYHFITRDQSIDMIRRGEYIEAKLYAGNVYGTTLGGAAAALDAGLVAINDVEVQGVDEYKKLLPNTIAIFILPPNFDEWVSRLRRRYSTDEEFNNEWPKRRDTAVTELTHALEVPYYHFVINDDLGRAVEVVKKMALGSDRFTRKDDEARLAARDLLEIIQQHN